MGIGSGTCPASEISASNSSTDGSASSRRSRRWASSIRRRRSVTTTSAQPSAGTPNRSAAKLTGATRQAIFLEVAVADASEFAGDVVVGGELVGRHAVLRARGVAVPNTLAAIMLEVARQTAEPPHIYFAWSERGPGENALLFLIGGGGDIPPLTHEILRVAEPDPARRPLVHVGG